MTSTPYSQPEEPGGPPPDKLAFSLPSGRRRVTPVRVGREFRRDRLLPLLIRKAVLDDEGQQCVQVRLSAKDAANPAARALLDTEAGTALHLHQTLGDTEYAALFPRIIGYELDTAEPVLLYEPPRGTLVERLHVMSATDQERFTRDLLLALYLLEGQGLVPRGVSPATVRWDGAKVQLWGLESVTRTGQPRRPWGRSPFCAPEQRRGEGLADPRDAVWSAAQVLYQLVTGRPGPADRAPADLGEHRKLDQTLRDAFAPRAARRPTPAQVLDVVAPDTARRVRLAVPADETSMDQEAFDQALRRKREHASAARPQESAAAAGRGNGEVLCPYCLETIQLDLAKLFVTDSRMQYKQLDLKGINNPVRRNDIMRGAVQKCTADADFPEHFIPVPYLTYGRPLTVAMVGQSSTGKSHLLTQMIAAITDGGLEPFGLKWQSVNPEQHAKFVRDRVQPLRNGNVLDHTAALGLEDFARFVESLLITDARGQVRPVAFFDLGGEDLVRTDAALRFLLGVDALVFVVDPALALPLPQLNHARERWGVEVNPDGDLAFGTVLDRLPKTGGYVDVPAAVVLGKADLLRFQPPVDRWLGRPPATSLDPALMREESRDVYGLLRRHAGPAWLRPFDAIRRCTLHVASATGGQEDRGRYPAGAGPRRVLEPLLALLTMHGLIQVPGGAEALAGVSAGSDAPAVEWLPPGEGGAPGRSRASGRSGQSGQSGRSEGGEFQ
ncbi:hypothetical protein [Streptomyces sp. NBC_00878]|uniref:hypothetical protein n=1 Tax=Streptomyces sp. NBC_00878 TaxID=2975854 RepID=UPI00225B8815|nr:hypothetical protein [Streptomyces sp. NBC_00878]MCX4907392.1 hypothetical protein [Streptomyces sp. NBC_00878]